MFNKHLYLIMTKSLYHYIIYIFIFILKSGLSNRIRTDILTIRHMATDLHDFYMSYHHSSKNKTDKNPQEFRDREVDVAYV